MEAIGEIKKLKQLLDDGIITKEDFDEQKKKILGISVAKEKIMEQSIIELEKEKTESKHQCLEDYEKQLMTQTKRIEDNGIEKINEKNNDEYYEKEKLKEKAKLDAKEEIKKEKIDEFKESTNKAVNTGKRIVKWILATFCWIITLGCIITLSQNIILNLSNAFIFIILGAMACPKITNYTQNFKRYTKYKKWIVIVLIIVFIILCNIVQY